MAGVKVAAHVFRSDRIGTGKSKKEKPGADLSFTFDVRKRIFGLVLYGPFLPIITAN